MITRSPTGAPVWEIWRRIIGEMAGWPPKTSWIFSWMTTIVNARTESLIAITSAVLKYTALREGSGTLADRNILGLTTGLLTERSPSVAL
jgi:hypothetical protein